MVSQFSKFPNRHSRFGPYAVGIALAALLVAACSSEPSDQERALDLAYKACTQEEDAGGSTASIARLATQAAQLDDRWRTLADYATSLNSAGQLAESIEEQDRQATESELETIRQGRQDGPRLVSECEAVRAQVEGN